METDVNDTIKQAQQGLIPITIDHIYELKYMGKYIEAAELVKAYQTNMQANWSEAKRKMRNINTKIYVFRKKKDGLCVACGKPFDNDNKLKCKPCLIKHNMLKRNKYNKYNKPNKEE